MRAAVLEALMSQSVAHSLLSYAREHPVLLAAFITSLAAMWTGVGLAIIGVAT
jgi:hypothetical protein